MVKDEVDALSQIVARGLRTAVTIDNHKSIDALSGKELRDRKTFVNRADVLKSAARANNRERRIRITAEKEESRNRSAV